MYATAGNMSDFTGVLVRRQYKPGQKYIQLLFKTGDGVKLSITRNLQMVRSLKEGLTYRVKGTEYVVGKKTIIHEPVATLVQSKPSFFRQRSLLIAAGLIVFVIAVAASALLIVGQGSANHSQPQAEKPAAQTTQVPDASNATPAQATTVVQPTTAPPPASSTSQAKKTTTRKATPAVSANNAVQPAPNPPAAQPPAANDQPPSDTVPPPTDPTPPPADPTPPPDTTPTDPTIP
jgi:cytoskeletal protein RodZ